MRRIRALVSSAFLFLLLATTGFAKTRGWKDLQWLSPQAVSQHSSVQAQKGGTLVLPISSFPSTFRQVGPDANDSFRQVLDEMEFSLISWRDETQQWVPVLAEAWALSQDGKTVHFRLNPKARWSDGSAITAADYLYTWEWMRSPFIQSPWHQEFYGSTIIGIEAATDEEKREIISIKLSVKTLDALYLANIKPTPRHFYREFAADYPSRYNWRIPPHAGPYQLSSFEKGKSLTLTRIKDWWGDQLPLFAQRYNLDTIIYKVVRDPNLAWEYLKAGEIDLMTLTQPDLWRAMEKEEKFHNGWLTRHQIYHQSPRADYNLVLNQQDPILADKRVREAFAFAMNVDRVISELLLGDFQRLQGLSRGYGDFTNNKLRPREFNLQKAIQLLQAAGWDQLNAEGIRLKGKQSLSLTVSYAQSMMTPRLLVLAEDAKKSGIELKLQLLEASSLMRFYREKKHQIAVGFTHPSYRPEYRSRFHSSFANISQNSNFSNTASPVLDNLIEEYEHASDDRTRIQKAHAIQNFVFEDASYVPLFEVPYFRLAYWGWIQFPEISSAKDSDRLSLFDATRGGYLWIDAKRREDIQLATKRGNRWPARTRIDTQWRELKEGP